MLYMNLLAASRLLLGLDDPLHDLGLLNQEGTEDATCEVKEGLGKEVGRSHTAP